MLLINALRKECVIAGLKLDDKSSALKKIAAIAKASELLKDVSENEIFDGLQEREALGSTGFKGSIAIPHCRLKAVKDFVVGMLSVPDGVDFASLDNGKVKLLVFIIAPLKESDEHIHLLSAISQIISIPEAVNEMVIALSSEALYESFLRLARDEVKTEKGIGRNIMHVFVQNEDMFQAILEIFGSIETSSAIVLDAENMGAYLLKLPLFAGLWVDHPHRFSRLIVALVSKNMTNETIRRIERITGPLKNCTEVLVTIQDIFYCAGSLKT